MNEKTKFKFTKTPGAYANIEVINERRISLLDYEWIAQDQDGGIYIYNLQPEREHSYWYKNSSNDSITTCIIPRRFDTEISDWEEQLFNIHEDEWDITSEGILIGKKNIGIKLNPLHDTDFDWIAQDKNGDVFVYEDQPFMYHNTDMWSENNTSCQIYYSKAGIEISDWRQRIYSIKHNPTESNGNNFYINKDGELIESRG